MANDARRRKRKFSPVETETLALRPFSVTIPHGMVTIIAHSIEEA
jgi:hypothetical protein